jgi:hypothetical protein
MTKKTYMINHIPIKQMWLKENIILLKDVQKWVDEKLLKNLMKKKVLHNISQDQSSKIGYSKMKTVNHINIYNLMFSLVSNYYICSPCYMTSNVEMVTLHLNLNYICNKLFLCCLLNLINTPKPPN